MSATTDLLDLIDTNAAEATKGTWRKGTTAWGTHNVYADESAADVTYPDGFKHADDAEFAASVDPKVAAALVKVVRVGIEAECTCGLGEGGLVGHARDAKDGPQPEVSVHVVAIELHGLAKGLNGAGRLAGQHVGQALDVGEVASPPSSLAPRA